MNKRNLTAAVLAGLAGVAGLGATAQAVNINPDGTGQVLIYPYYTTNDGNQTILSVVNTTDQGKAVKVRFLEGFNSREVLDFNLYMSAHDVWVAALADGGDLGFPSQAGVTHIVIPDTTCTVPYLYGAGIDAGLDFGLQAFLPYAFTGNAEDGGPTDIERAAEGHFEMIEMGTIGTDTDAYADLVHKDSMPVDCDALTDRWTEFSPGPSGIWFEEAEDDGKAETDTSRNSGGLFGGAAIVNSGNGTMFSYDATALQGFDKSDNGMHYIPGTIFPSLNSGDQFEATVFFGVPQDRAVTLTYANTVDAVSALFMHNNIMNEYNVEADLNASTEWVVTFPTKNFYADAARMKTAGLDEYVDTCPGDDDGPCLVQVARNPFTELFGEEDCEVVGLKTWDREENTFEPAGPPGGARPPTVSPSVPGCDPIFDDDCRPDETPFQLCNEVNVLRFGEGSIFGTPTFDEGSLLLSVSDEFDSGWGWINFGGRKDDEGLVGLPVAGFAAMEFENGFLDGGSVKANYGGLFGHKASVRRQSAP